MNNDYLTSAEGFDMWKEIPYYDNTRFPKVNKDLVGIPRPDGIWDEDNHGLKKLGTYLYEITYTSPFDYDKADLYYQRYAPVLGGACSAFRKGNYLGRNYDWFYTNEVELILRSPRGKDSEGNVKYGSIGVISSGLEVNEFSLDRMEFLFPFLTVDGINENGVCVELNVLTPDEERYGRTTGTNPGKKRMCELAVSRYILDYATSVDHAISLLGERDIYGCFKEGFNEEFHFMVADENKTVVLEFVENELVVMTPEKPIMTNFYLTGFDGNLKTGFNEEEPISPETTTLGKYACGVERFEIIRDSYDTVEEEGDVMNVMKSIRYTKAYKSETNPFWYSEFVGVTGTFGDLTIYLPKSEFTGIVDYVQDKYAQHLRDGSTWQTTHTSIYDIPKRTLSVMIQEEDTVYKFNL